MVLRDIHCALVRLIQNQGLEKDKKDSSKGQPSTGKLFSPDSGGPVPWTAMLAHAILSAPPGKAAATAKVSCLSMACHQSLACSALKAGSLCPGLPCWLKPSCQHLLARLLPLQRSAGCA